MNRIRLKGFVCLIALILFPCSVQAASIENCREAVSRLDAALPAGLTDIWADIIRERIDGINAQTDAGALYGELDQVWTDYEAYQREPDPDGDGVAMAPEVAEAETGLLECLYNARIAEVTSAFPDDAESVEDTGMPAPDDLEKPPFPANNPGDWFAGLEYPVLAVRENRSGVVRYEVTVGQDGRPVGCQASGPADSADLELATCDAVMAAALFEPATSSEGQPVVGEYSGELNWAIPE
jgi:hypothetical protein